MLASVARTRFGPTRVSKWVLGLALAGAALAVGAVHTITLCVVTAILLGAALLGGAGAEPARSRSAATLLLITGVGLTLYTALQCVPMPLSWLSVVAPHNADVWSRALTPLHEGGPAWAPISLDPIATRVEVLKGMAYLLAFITALWIARRRDGTSFLSGTVVITALVLGVAAVLHPAFGAQKLFGVYAPASGAAGRHLAPLMNPNNLAGYLNVALCLSLASLLAPEPPVPRPIGAAVVLLLAAVQVWVASRGGVIAMAIGAFVVIVIARISRARHSGAATRLTLVSAAGMAVGAAFFALGGSDEVPNELFDTNASKLTMAVELLRPLRAMPILGCGRGAFESTFPAFRIHPGHVTLAYPENVVVQWLVEWGAPVGLAGLVLVAFALRPNVVLARSTTAGGAWAALVALTVQNLVDLGTEVPGLMFAGVVCAAIVVAGTPGRSTRWKGELWSRWPRRVAATAGLTAAAVIVWVGAGLGKELHDDQGVLHEAALRPVSAQEMHALARAAMLRHPAEPYFPFITSFRAARERDDNALPWIGAALERARVYGVAHLVLARVVAPRSASQARLEYRLALEQMPELVGVVFPREAPRVVASYDDALDLVPRGKVGVAVLEQLVQAIGDRLPATRARLDAEMVVRAPNSTGPPIRSAQYSVQDLEMPWCEGGARDGCIRKALAMATVVQRLEPEQCEGFALHARARAASGDAAGGVAELEQAADQVRDRLRCFEQVVTIAREGRLEAQTEAALRRIVAAGCGSSAECSDAFLWVGGQYEAMGRMHEALNLYKRAFEQVPDDQLLGRIAALAAAMGLHAEAAQDYDQLARHHPGDAQWRSAADAEHRAAMQDTVRF
jgi:tetratricopeptide (TPR) repeat protein